MVWIQMRINYIEPRYRHDKTHLLIKDWSIKNSSTNEACHVKIQSTQAIKKQSYFPSKCVLYNTLNNVIGMIKLMAW